VHRFFLPPEHCRSDSLILTGGEAHHALKVLRLRTGDAVTVLNGQGLEFSCRVSEAGRKEVRVDVTERRSHPSPACRVTLLQAIPKGRLMDAIIQKAVELGVSRIVPLLSLRVVTDPGEEGAARKTERWSQTAIEAIKQCGNPWLPAIEPPVTPSHFLDRREPIDLSFIASLQPGSKLMGEHFTALRAKRPQLMPASVAIWIGPEGDFSAAEIEAVIKAGALPITLGPLVLRSETAAISALSVLAHEVQLLTRSSRPMS
jgi:16S rRNA (uracil1498-N3)-methyltransferase